MRKIGLAALALAAVFLHACASTPKAAPDAKAAASTSSKAAGSAPRAETPPAERIARGSAPSERAPEPPANLNDLFRAAAPGAGRIDGMSPASLPGWDSEDHAAALIAYQSGCALSRDPAAQETCNAARLLGEADDATARHFFETAFRVEQIGGPGLLTAYFSPQYEAREAPGGDFTAAVRAAPADLKPGQTYADRSAIEDRPPNGALAWMRAEDLFFLQIQGSGTLVYPDGRRMKAVFAAHNSRPFVGIANPMRERGLLAAGNTSGDAIRSWLADHRGRRANEIMQLNPRYVFFRLEADDGQDPQGAAGISLPAGHAIAVDPSFHAYGEAVWIDASAPTLTGAFPTYRRLVMALDTGGAIKGEVRADLYLGRGDDAGREAGRVRHDLKMYRLAPLGRLGG
jgi:membrane-bound lytic murein transglycosylase A